MTSVVHLFLFPLQSGLDSLPPGYPTRAFQFLMSRFEEVAEAALDCAHRTSTSLHN